MTCEGGEAGLSRVWHIPVCTPYTWFVACVYMPVAALQHWQASRSASGRRAIAALPVASNSVYHSLLPPSHHTTPRTRQSKPSRNCAPFFAQASLSFPLNPEFGCGHGLIGYRRWRQRQRRLLPNFIATTLSLLSSSLPPSLPPLQMDTNMDMGGDHDMDMGEGNGYCKGEGSVMNNGFGFMKEVRGRREGGRKREGRRGREGG